MGLSFWENFWLSGTAAGIGKTAGAPIERVKVLFSGFFLFILFYFFISKRH